MIQTLQRLKAKKGFTIIELVVVMAILGVLMAIIFPMLTSKKAKIDEANTTAKDFYSALQSIMMKYSLYDGPLSPAYRATPELGDMYYYEKLGGNYPFEVGTTAGETPVTTSLYIEVEVKNGQLGDIVTGATAGTANALGLFNMLNRAPGRVNNEFGRLLKAELEDRISYRDGYYYANVTYVLTTTGTIPTKMEAETVKVAYTGYCRERMPDTAGKSFAQYKNENFYFGEDNVLVNGEIFGVCAAFEGTSTIGLIGTNLK